MDVVIPSNISSLIIQKGRLNSVSTYFSLRTMYEGSVIFNFYSRLKEMSDYTGLSKKTLKKHVSQLLEDGIGRMDKDNLVLIGKEKLLEWFGITQQPHYFKEYFSKSTKSKDIKDWLRVLVIKENKTKQQYAIRYKNEKYSGKSNARLRKLSRGGDFNSTNVSNEKIQLSQYRIAKLFGCNWSSSAGYHIRKLTKKGYIKSEQMEPRFISKGNGMCLRALRDLNPSYSYFKTQEGKIYQRRCNKLTIL